MVKIKIIIGEQHKEPETFNFLGYQAVELALLKISEKFLSPKISKEIENVLKYKED